MSYMPDITEEERLGAAEIAAGLTLAYREAHASSDPVLRDRTTYLGVLAFERLRPLLGYSYPGNLVSLAAKNAISGSFIWAALHADEACQILTTNKPPRTYLSND